MKSTSLVARHLFALFTVLISSSFVGCGEMPAQDAASTESALAGAPPEAPLPPDGRPGTVRGHVGGGGGAIANRQVAVFWDCHYGWDGRPGLGWTYECTSGGDSCTSFYVGGSWSDYTCTF
jgi:hypothetical protein